MSAPAQPAAPMGGQMQIPPVSSGKVMEGSAQYQPAMFAQLGLSTSSADTRNLEMLLDVPLQITVELGKAQIPIRQILEYGQGSLITLDKLAGEPIDMLVNGRYFAKAEVVVIDENFGVRITSILSPAERLAQVR
jgi:flagellar motor switch protein FliN/FliY